MNKLCYRTIFSKVRGMLIVVSEIARSGYSRVARNRQHATDMEIRVRISPVGFAIWLAAGFVSMPALASIVADSSAPGNQQPTVIATANGLPQINIQTPNSHGVSRNTYSQLDVDQRGAILNNSHKNIQTELGGMVTANPWLSKQEASVILNEVNSRNPSQLNGFIEVAGKRATVIIANPAGITCDGCGFINASRNTLTTGQAIMENGELKGFDVTGGRINIEGKGLNDSDADYTQIIAQSVTVNARVHARDLNVVTGKNQVAADGSVTTVKASDAATRPAFALDVAAVGGMYANKIVLTGTEKGVGVRNAGELGAGAGELRLSVDGTLENSGTLQSSETLQIASQGDQQNSGKLLSSQSITLAASGALRNSGQIRASRDVTLAASRIESSRESILAAGVDDSGSVTQPGSLVLSSQGELKAQGKNLAHDQLQAQGSRVDLAGSQTAAGDITLTATQGDISTSEARLTGEQVRAQAATDLNNDNGQLSAGTLTVTAKNISNNGGLLRQQNHETLTLNAGSLQNNQGTIVNEGDTAIQAVSIENRSGLIAGNGSALRLDTQRLDNQAGKIQLAGNGALTLNAVQLDGNKGVLLSNGALSITGKKLDLSQGQTQAQALTLSAETLNHQQGLLSQRGTEEMTLALSGALDNQAGRIESGGSLNASADRLNNSHGTLLAAGQGDLQLSVQYALNNTSGNLLSSRHLSLSAGAVQNQQGLVSATGGEARLTSGQAIDNVQGRIEAAQQLTTHSRGLNNQSGTLLGGAIAVDARQGELLNANGSLVAKNALDISSGQIDNRAGLLQSGSDLTIDAHGEPLTNTDSGKAGILSGGTLLLNSGDFDNRNGVVAAAATQITSGNLTNVDGAILADKALSLATQFVDNQRGLLQAGEGLTLDTHGARLNNSDSGERGGIVARGGLQLQTGEIQGSKGFIQGQNVVIDTHQQTFLNQQGFLSAQGDLWLNSGEMDNRAGILVSTGTTQLNSGALTNTDGKLVADKDLTLTTGAVNNQRGLLQAGNLLSLDTQGAELINTDSGASGGIIAFNDLDLRSAGITNQSGFIAAGKQATLTTGELNNSQGQVAGNGGLAFNGLAINNTEGKLQSAGDLTINTAGQTLSNQRGLIAGSGNARIDSGLLDNQNGQLQGGEALTLSLGQNALFNQSGKLFSAGTLALTAAQLNNQSGQLQSLGSVALLLAQQLDNSGGLIKSDRELDLTTSQLINQDTRQAGKGIEADSLTLQANTLDNSQGALRAITRLALTVKQALENSGGLLSSSNALTVTDGAQGQALTIHNQQGTVIADNAAEIRAASLSGDGQVLSQGNLDITLAGDFDNRSEVKANGALHLTTGGKVTNSGAITSQQALWLTAQKVTNQTSGEISAKETHITAADSLNNTGLIDGGLTHLVANVLNNTGTGRIYGDNIALSAETLNNLSDGSSAAVIAARNRLDAGIGSLNNRDHALIYSIGDLHIGGYLDENNQAAGQEGQLNNHGATIEAGRDVSIAMAEVNNTNRNLITETVITENSEHHEAVLKNQTTRYDWAEVDTSHKNKYKVKDAIMPDGSRSNEFYEYQYQRVVEETQVKESDPGKILSGGNMTFTGDRLLNSDSQIVAGAALNATVGELTNQATTGTRVTTDSGKVTRWYAKKKHHHVGGTETSQGEDTSNYLPAPITETIVLHAMAWQENSAPQSSGYQTRDRQQQTVTAQAETAGAVNSGQMATAVELGANRDDSALNVKDRPLVLPAGQQYSLTLPSTVIDGQTITPVIRVVAPDTRLPDNSLFKIVPASDSHYLVETDPRFVNQKQWLSSDYMQEALSADGSQMLKRLGDGYYEQQLIRNQIIQLTGSRYLSGYSNDEEQYRALMNNGIAFGKAFQLTPGVALTPAQMALLTSDIVWLVNQTVTLPDGSQQTVLVPQLYARLKEGDLTGDGALLSGGSVALSVQQDITNSGTIHGREVTQLSAQSLTNSGYIDGNQVSLTARQDISNTGGTISGSKQVSLLAGRNIISQSTVRDNGSDSWIDRAAGIYVQGANGELTLSALNNITLTGSTLVNAGSGLTQIQAGNDLTLDALSLQHSENSRWGGDNYRLLSQQTDVGTRIDAAGALRISAGQDINATAAGVVAGGALSASAGRDIVLIAGSSSSDLIEHSKQSSKGWLSGSSVETHDEIHDRQALSTTLSGDSVQLLAGRDISISGSNVVGTQDVALAAGRNLSVTTAGESHSETHQREEKKSGLMGSGGIGFTVGKAELKSTTDTNDAQSKGSTLGSSNGSVTLSAGNQLSIHGSDLVAGKDLALSGSEVRISAAENSHTALTRTEQKQSGLTVALSGTAGSALNTAVKTAKQAREESDERLAALQGTKAALNGISAAQAVRLDEAQGDDRSNNSTVGVSLSYGSQRSQSESAQAQTTQQGSSLTAGRNLSITASGTDITVQGSQLQAGKDVLLSATRDVNLLSAEESSRTRSQNSSKGGSVGVGITAGSGGAGYNVSASVNSSKGHENAESLSHLETQVTAGGQAILISGRDTTLTGAQVSGESVKAEVGRNLTIRSEQDSETYESKQQNSSAGAGFTFGAGGSATANVSASRDRMSSDWQSVREQSGIFAGKGGFDVTVGEHTQLDGAVIGSTATADKNRLETGTLGWRDIHNHAAYETEHTGAGISTGGGIGEQFAGNMANGVLAGLNGSESADSVTKSAVSEGSIVVRDTAKQAQDVAQLSRDVENENPGLAQIFDKEKEQSRLAQSQLIAEIGSQALDIAGTEGRIAGEKAKRDPKKLADARAQLESEGKAFTDGDVEKRAYDTAMKPFGTGSSLQQAIQATAAAVQGLAGGNIGQAISGAAAPYLAEQIHIYTKDNPEAKAMAHAVVGAVASYASGNAALAGAAGAVSGELMAQLVMKELYPGKGVGELTEEQKQTISALGTLAAGLTGGLTGDSTANAVAGAQAGKNAVENNQLHEDEARQLDKEMLDCKKTGGDCSKVAEKYIEISNKNSQELKAACTGGGVTCVTWEELIQADTNVARDENPGQFRLSEKLKDPSAAALVNYLNGADLKFLKDNISSGDRVMAVVMDPASWPTIVMGGRAILTNAVNNTKEQLIAVGVGISAGAGIQYGTTGEVKLSDMIDTGLIGAITAGKGYNPTMTWNAAGSYYQAKISGDDPFMAALLSKAGASAGYAAGNVIKVPMDKILNPVSKQYEWVPSGVWTITKPVSQHPLPSVAGNIGDSIASGLVPGYLEQKEETGK